MGLNRREFLKITGITTAGAAFSGGLDLGRVQAWASETDLRIRYARETTTICPYCAVGCGLIVHNERGRVINTEGDPDHPINQGALCAKGAALYQMAVNDQRLTEPLYRAPGSHRWEVRSWDWTIRTIARRVKETRDRNFIEKNDKDQVVNRTEAIAHVGSAALDNEECWTLQAMMRALGLVYIEHQARI